MSGNPARMLVLFLCVAVFTAGAAGAEEGSPGGAEGLIIVRSGQEMEKTLADLREAVAQLGLTYFATFDHAENARSNTLALFPTSVVVFGNPLLGTPMMQARRTLAIDLPQKMLVWEDADEQVWIAYNDPQYLARRHSLADQEKILDRVGKALAELARLAAGRD